MYRHLGAIGRPYKSLICLISIFLGLGSPAFSAPELERRPSKPKRISLQFEYENTPLKMAVYELGDVPAIIGDIKQVPLGSSPFKDKISGSAMVYKGQNMPFAMVVENTTNEDQYFFANVHYMEPTAGGLGIFLKCLCINRIYRIRPKSVWYRIGEINLTNMFRVEELVIKHALVGMKKSEIDAKRMQRMVME